MSYVLGRNCRFLQGPKTNPSSVRRIREKLEAGKEHCETFINYRRDGSPFMNLLMVAPLYDSRGVVRYHIGAQIDVSGLARDCAGLESLERVVADHEANMVYNGTSSEETGENRQVRTKDEFRELAVMFSPAELKTVREAGGTMHRIHQDEVGETDGGGSNGHRPRILIRDEASLAIGLSESILTSIAPSGGGRLTGVFEHYLLVRPDPNLRIVSGSLNPCLLISSLSILFPSLVFLLGGFFPFSTTTFS